MYKFGKTSKKRLSTCHEDLQLIMNTAIKMSTIDFGIAEGYRSIEKQQEYYAQGRSKPGKIITKIDGINQKGNHNYKPSLAVDIYDYVNGKALYNIKNLKEIANLIKGTAQFLYERKLINHKIAWGGDWKWKDYPHFELK